jgi:hypothetical protein
MLLAEFRVEHLLTPLIPRTINANAAKPSQPPPLVALRAFTMKPA